MGLIVNYFQRLVFRQGEGGVSFMLEAEKITSISRLLVIQENVYGVDFGNYFQRLVFRQGVGGVSFILEA